MYIQARRFVHFVLLSLIPTIHTIHRVSGNSKIKPSCLATDDCASGSFCNSTNICLPCATCACENIATKCHLTCDTHQALALTLQVAGLENSESVVTLTATAIVLFVFILTCVQQLHLDLLSAKFWNTLCKHGFRNKQTVPTDFDSAIQAISEKTPYRYNLKVLLVDEHSDRTLCFLGKASLKENATVKDLEEQSIELMERAYHECTRKWLAAHNNSKYIKDGTNITTTVATELGKAIEICLKNKKMLKHLLCGAEDTLFIDKNDLENVYKYSETTTKLKCLRCGTKFKRSEHTSLLKKLEATGSSSLNNPIIPVEVCVPVTRGFDVHLMDAMEYLLKEDARNDLDRGLLYKQNIASKIENDLPSSISSPGEKKDINWLRSTIKRKVFNLNLFRKSRDVSKKKIEFWAMNVHNVDIANAHKQLVEKVNISSSHIVDNIQILAVALLTVIFIGLVTQLGHLPLRNVYVPYLVVTAIFCILMEITLLVICTKSEKRRSDQKPASDKATAFHLWMYIVLLFLASIILPIVLVTFVSTNGTITVIPAVNTTNLEIIANGCNYLLSPATDNNIKVTAKVVNGIGSATWARVFDVKYHHNTTVITATPDTDATAMISEAWKRSGVNSVSDEAKNQNSTNKFNEKSSLPSSLQYKCTIEIFIPPGLSNDDTPKNDISIHLVQPELEVHTSSVNDILHFKALKLDATDLVYGRINARLYQLRLNVLHIESHIISTELTKVSSDFTELKAFELYGAAEMILRGKTQTALRVTTTNVHKDLVCVRSGGQLFKQSDSVAFLASNNDNINFAALQSNSYGQFTIRDMLKGYFAVDTNEGICNKAGPSMSRSYSVNDTIPSSMTFEKESIMHFKAALGMYDIVIATVWGYEVPFLSSWSFTNNEAYQFFSSSYVSAFSLTMLAPSTHTVELHIDGSTCATGSHLNNLKLRETQLALALRKLIGEESDLKLTFVNASGRFHRVPSYGELEHGAPLTIRQWSESIQWIVLVSAGATAIVCFILIFLWQSVGRIIYSERMDFIGLRYCKEVTATRREVDIISRRNLIYQHSITLPHLTLIHLLQLELYFNRKGKSSKKTLVKWPW